MVNNNINNDVVIVAGNPGSVVRIYDDIQTIIKEKYYDLLVYYDRSVDMTPQIEDRIDNCKVLLIVLESIDYFKYADSNNHLVRKMRYAKANNKEISLLINDSIFSISDELSEKLLNLDIAFNEVFESENVTLVNYYDSEEKIQQIFKDLINNLSKKSGKDYEKRRKEYFDGIKSKDFIEWQMKTLEKLYGNDDAFTLLNEFGQNYPVICIKGSEEFKFSFDETKTKKNLKFKYYDLEDKFKNDTQSELEIRRKFLSLISDTIKMPNLYGYNYKSFKFSNKDGGVEAFNATIGRYIDCVATCHVLQYELWDAFKKKNKNKNDLALLEDLPLRKNIHNNQTIKELLCNGDKRSALCDVAMVIVTKGKNDKEYKILTGLRSEKVSCYAGYLSIVPSGSFEIFSKVTDNSNYNEFVLQNNFSLVNAIFREYIEELFGVDVDEPSGNDDLNRVMNNKHVIQIRESIENGFSKFKFMGLVYDMITLRPTFTFALIVNDQEIINEYNNLTINFEHENLKFMNIKDFKKIIENKKLFLMPESAGVYSLLEPYIKK